MSIYEYDQAKHIRQERQEAWEEGREEGITIGREAGRVSLLKEQISKKLSREKSISEIAEDLELEESELTRLIEELHCR